jgi:hypothetical protein
MSKEINELENMSNSNNESDNDNDSNNDSNSNSDNQSGGAESSINIDLTNNPIYQGICTLFEDEDGNNILEYISLLHTELININKNMENVVSIKNDIHRIANSIESYVKHQGIDVKKEKKVSKKE